MNEKYVSNSVGPVIAVVAAYNPDKEFLQRVVKLRLHVAEIVVVDDGSDQIYGHDFDAIASLGVEVLHHPINLGIAAALNTGVRHARRTADPHFILTMDQDSELGSDYIRRALETYEAAAGAGLNVGLVSAESFNGVPALTDYSIGPFKVPFDPWQSGMLIPSNLFDAGLGFNEEYFIDNVDSEFSLHAKVSSFVPIMGAGCDLSHNLGEPKVRTLLGRDFTYTYHSPKRIYYITRNSLFLVQDYFTSYPKWFVRKAFHDILNQSIRFFLSEDKRSVVRAIIAGAADGLRRRGGRFEDRGMPATEARRQI